jgi:hypothetical protein
MIAFIASMAMRWARIAGIACAGLCFSLASGSALALVFNGTLYYTVFSGAPNVFKINYSYDETTTTFTLGAPTVVGTTNGADGIIFLPNGNLLIGGQGANHVTEMTPAGVIVTTQALTSASFHETLANDGSVVYTSSFGGPLQTVNIPIGTGATPTTITGGDSGITQVAFGDEGTAFYVDGSPNGFGNLGLINIATGVTTRLYTGVQPAHGLIYDPFTDLITMFGAGHTGTMNDVTGGNLLTSATAFTCDFDQGAVDGFGHALVAGCGGITFIDYHLSGDITNPNFFTTQFGFGAIDDVAPLTGAGSNPAPEPGTLLLLAAGIAGLAAARRRLH